MKKDWSVGELIEHFTLTSDDLDWLSGQATYNQLGQVTLKGRKRTLRHFRKQPCREVK